MNLKVLASGSKGNSYIFTANNGESIIVEQGIKHSELLKGMDHDLSKVKFGLCTHVHLDHFKGTKDLLNAGIEVIMSKGEYESKYSDKHHNMTFIKHAQKIIRGDWEVAAFNVNHDTPEPLGFLIYHPESGLNMFLTDSYFVEYTFPGLNNILIESNFCESIMQERYDIGYLKAFLRDRIAKSHLSLSNCLDILKANDLTSVHQILLLHLSDSNSDSRRFQSEVYEQTLKTVNVAKPGLNLSWNKTPFAFF